MPSAAGHDAQVLATIMPAGMLFVPSIGGISHHWTENTADADIVTGAEVFVDACRRLLAGDSSSSSVCCAQRRIAHADQRPRDSSLPRRCTIVIERIGLRHKKSPGRCRGF